MARSPSVETRPTETFASPTPSVIAVNSLAAFFAALSPPTKSTPLVPPAERAAARSSIAWSASEPNPGTLQAEARAATVHSTTPPTSAAVVLGAAW